MNIGRSDHDLTDPDDEPSPSPIAPAMAAPKVCQLTLAIAKTDPPFISGGVAANDEHFTGLSPVVEDFAVVIVGGGPAGFAALETLVDARGPVRNRMKVLMIDDAPTEQLGRGVPFRKAPGAAADLLFMNMTGPSISFKNDARKIWEGLVRRGNCFVPDFPTRCATGEVLGEFAQLALSKAVKNGLEVQIVRGRAIDIDPVADGMVVVKTTGGEPAISAHAVILTVGNESGVRYAHCAGQGFISDPWSCEAGLQIIPPAATVAVAGTSLSAMDAASVLKGSGHIGAVHMFSPSGKLPGIRPLHEPVPLKVLHAGRLAEIVANKSAGRSLTLAAVRRLVRDEFRAQGLSMKPLTRRRQAFKNLAPLDFLMTELEATCRVDARWGLLKSLDDAISPLWYALDAKSQRLALKYLGTFAALQWSAAPPTGLRILALLHAKQLTVHRAHDARRRAGGGFEVLRDGEVVFGVDFLIDASGFPGQLGQFTNPLVQSLTSRGILIPHENGLGAQVDFATGRALGPDGLPSAPLWVGACALTRGVFLLSNELGEATRSAVRCAKGALQHLYELAHREAGAVERVGERAR